MSDGDKGGGGGSNPVTGAEMMNQGGQEVLLSQQNMASLQHQQAIQMQQQAAAAAAAAQQQAGMEAMQQTSQAQSVNQTQALLVNTANLHQQLQSSSSGSNNQAGMASQGGSQGGTTNAMCLQQGIQSSMASSPGLHQQQQIGSLSLQGTNVGGNQSGSTTITTMSTLPQQQQATAQPQLQQVQVIQQPMQNPYLQQVYNSQGQMLMSVHPNMNTGSIQVIAAGKPFQSNQLTSHVLSKPVLAAANAQQGSFPGYATIPTSTNQTLVITGGQLGVISGQLPQTQPKPQDLQKGGGGGGSSQVKAGTPGNQTNQQVIAQNCVASHPMLHHLISPIQYTTCGNGRQTAVGSQTQAQAVQIASPWQFPQLPQVWATQSPHHQVIQNPIFIRGPQQDQPMFIHQSPPPSQGLQQPPQQQGVGVGKQEMKSGGSGAQVSRTLSILPSTSMAPPIRPATSASTQIVKSQQIKMRTKAILTKSNIAPQKDAQNQTKPAIQVTTSPQPPHQILPATKMIITSQGTIVQGPIDNKVVGQVAGSQQQSTTGVAMPQAAVAMPQGAVAMPQAAVAMSQAVVHQPQLIQPKPPSLMSLSMPSLEPMPPPSEKPIETVPSMEIVCGTVAPSPPVSAVRPPSAQQGQERLSEESAQGEDSVNLLNPSLSQQNGLNVDDSKAAEPMEVVEPDPTPPAVAAPHPPSSSAGMINGICAGSATSHPPTSVTHTTTIGNAVPLRSSSPAVASLILPTSQSNGQQSQPPDETKEKKTPKAMIKPHSQVLTHIIEGYVIQESSEPFPINRTNLLSDLSQQTKSDNQSSDSSNEPPVKKQSMDISGVEASQSSSDKLKCETCGKIDLKEKFKKKRFCSTQCARRSSSGGRKRSKPKDEGSKTEKEWVESVGETTSGISGGESNSDCSSEPLSNPLKWTVAEVCEFIKNLPGCKEYAEDFAIQEIDGQALILLKPDHLMSAMSMKLGPALKICAKIDTMRADNQTPGQPAPV